METTANNYQQEKIEGGQYQTIILDPALTAETDTTSNTWNGPEEDDEEDFDDEPDTADDDDEFPTEDDLATEDYIEDDDLYFEDEY